MNNHSKPCPLSHSPVCYDSRLQETYSPSQSPSNYLWHSYNNGASENTDGILNLYSVVKTSSCSVLVWNCVANGCLWMWGVMIGVQVVVHSLIRPCFGDVCFCSITIIGYHSFAESWNPKRNCCNTTAQGHIIKSNLYSRTEVHSLVAQTASRWTINTYNR